MAVLEMPVRSDFPSYKFSLTLEGRLFFFEFSFNTRMDRWIMDVMNDSRAAILQGIPIIAGTPLVDGYTIPALPPGVFVALDLAGQGRQPTRDNFGSDLKLYYVESTTEA